MVSELEHEQGEAHGLQPRQYVIIGVILTVITLIELAVSYSDLGPLLIPVLIVLSAVKFGIVVAYFMHLRFDPGLLAKLFVGIFILAAFVLLALATLFSYDLTRLTPE